MEDSAVVNKLSGTESVHRMRNSLAPYNNNIEDARGALLTACTSVDRRVIDPVMDVYETRGLFHALTVIVSGTLVFCLAFFKGILPSAVVSALYFLYNKSSPYFDSFTASFQALCFTLHKNPSSILTKSVSPPCDTLTSVESSLTGVTDSETHNESSLPAPSSASPSAVAAGSGDASPNVSVSPRMEVSPGDGRGSPSSLMNSCADLSPGSDQSFDGASESEALQLDPQGTPAPVCSADGLKGLAASPTNSVSVSVPGMSMSVGMSVSDREGEGGSLGKGSRSTRTLDLDAASCAFKENAFRNVPARSTSLRATLDCVFYLPQSLVASVGQLLTKVLTLTGLTAAKSMGNLESVSGVKKTSKAQAKFQSEAVSAQVAEDIEYCAALGFDCGNWVKEMGKHLFFKATDRVFQRVGARLGFTDMKGISELGGWFVRQLPTTVVHTASKLSLYCQHYTTHSTTKND